MQKIEPAAARTVAIVTLGCKVNQFESAAFQNSLEERGLDVLPASRPADLYVINTCAVTAKAGAQSRQAIRRALRQNPQARVVVTGCYSQVAAQEVLEISEQPICIVGNGYKHLLADIALSPSKCDLEMHMGDIASRREICDLTVRSFAGRTRAFLRVQDGCNRFCSYCIVPYSRGRSRSLPPARVLEQANLFADEGYRELVITGIHTGGYGHDLEQQTDLVSLLRLLLNKGPALRYRLSSLEPTEVSDELLGLMAANPLLMPHLHIPLQSGDNGVLKRMNRRYTRELYTEVVERCLAKLPDVSIGVDVLAGFPGEDEAAFANTYQLLDRLTVASLHVFPYSRRPGTVAAGLPDQVAAPVKDERVQRLRKLDAEKRQRFHAAQLGSIRQVLVEGKRGKRQLLKGFSDNYVPVFLQGPDRLINTVVAVRLTRLAEDGVIGELVDR